MALTPPDVRPIVDFHIDLSAIVVSSVGVAVTFMLHRMWALISKFLEQHQQHGERLDDAEQMVDRHSRAMMKQGILGLRVQQLHRVRRKDDVQYINRDDEPMMS